MRAPNFSFLLVKGLLHDKLESTCKKALVLLLT